MRNRKSVWSKISETGEKRSIYVNHVKTKNKQTKPNLKSPIANDLQNGKNILVGVLFSKICKPGTKNLIQSFIWGYKDKTCS